MSHSMVVIECNVLTVHLGECGGLLLVTVKGKNELKVSGVLHRQVPSSFFLPVT